MEYINAMLWQSGEQIGPYIINTQIGAGGMATVYQARQIKLDRDVAIKVMHQSYAQDENFLKRFEREARIVARLDHPHIVPVYDYDEAHGQPYLVMKYVDGMTLKRKLRRGALNPAETLEIMEKIADALTYAHTQGVLHRDIKPSNILIDSRGIPYLTDFGLARLKESGESTMSADTMLGTPHYISPEQAQGKPLDARTDVYALGIILYELVTGRVPFMADTSIAIVHNHIYTQPTPPRQIKDDIPVAVDAVLMKALAKNPAHRYDTPNTLLEAYKEATEGSVISPPTEQIAPQVDSGTTPPDAEQGKDAPDDGSRPRGVKITMGDGRVVLAAGNEAFNDSMVESTANTSDDDDEDSDDEPVIDPTLPLEEQIRQRVQHRIKKGREAFSSLFGQFMAFLFINFFIFNADGWINGMLDAGQISAPSFILWFTFIFWGLGLIGQTWDYWTKYGPGRRYQERQIDREIQREIDRRRRLSTDTQKQKNDKLKNDDLLDIAVRLTEDGELSQSFIEQIDRTEQKPPLDELEIDAIQRNDKSAQQ